jgi:hypothetical protein
MKVLTFAIIAACLTASPAAAQSYTGVSGRLPTGSAAISADGLVASFDFETYTAEGRLLDFGPFGNPGAVRRTQETSGRFGRARVFVDLTDVVDIPETPSLDLSGPLTITAWVRHSLPGLHQHLFSCDDIYVLWTTAQNQYRLADTQANGVTTVAGAVPIGRWHAVTAVLSATRGQALSDRLIAVWIDGQRIPGTFETTWAPRALRPNDGCLIGAAVSGDLAHQQFRFAGALDELQVFSRALSEEEIRAYANR